MLRRAQKDMANLNGEKLSAAKHGTAALDR